MSDIALFVPALRGGGAQRVMVNPAQGLVERGRSVDLVLVTKMPKLCTSKIGGVE